MKQKNIAIIDTETAGGFGNLKIYDFGVGGNDTER